MDFGIECFDCSSITFWYKDATVFKPEQEQHYAFFLVH